MKKGKKCVALVLVLLMAIMSVGCGKKTDETRSVPGGDKEAVKSSDESTTDEQKSTASEFQTTFGSKNFDDVTITVEVFDRSNAPEGSTVIDNKWEDYINEAMGKVGIKVEFVAVPRAEEVSKIQLMMASQTAPDVMLCYNSAVVEGFFNDGGTIDLAPYIDAEDQAQNLKEYIGEECMSIGRNADNALWAVPARRSVTAENNLFLRKDWLDKLGMQIPTTVDELYNVIKAFKENNPEGRTDVVASSFYTEINIAAFPFLNSIADEKSYEINAGSTMDFLYTDPGAGEYFRWLNKLYNEGLMDPEYYVRTDQTKKEDFVSGRLGVLESNVSYNVDSMRGSLLQALKQNNPEADVISIPPMKNVNDGQVYNKGYSVNGAYVFIPQTCKNIEAAVTYLDWLATEEGGFTLFHGMEGEHFKYDTEGIPVIIDPEYNGMDKDWIRHDLFLIGNQGYYKTPEEFAKATSKEAPGFEQYVLDNYNNASAGIVRNNPTYTSPIYTEKNTEIGLLSDEYIVKIITCKPEEFDTNLSELLGKLKDVGYDEIVKDRTDYFNAVYSK
jgi:putative aldouronate transport system substrate-binding protein